MSNIEPARNFSNEQVALIRKSIAPTATPAEFELFIYRCRHMDLDPLKPGQIHFVKYGNSPGTIIVGREGFRSRAGQTGKHSGTKVGLLKDDNGKVIGAWCEVYRSDWNQPAREEVYLEEYDTGKAQWAKMKLTMIKKVAECAALRMAFPDQLGGMYEKAEMDQAEVRNVSSNQQENEPDPEMLTPEDFDSPHPALDDEDPGAHKIQFGKYNGATIHEVVSEEGLDRVENYCEWLDSIAKREGKSQSRVVTTFKVEFERYKRRLASKAVSA